MQKLFLDRTRPLYRIGAHYPLKSITTNDWIPFIKERFDLGKIKITDEQITMVCQITDNQPFYTQHLCHVLWESTRDSGNVTDIHIKESVKILMSRERTTYMTLWESFTTTEKKLLIGLSLDIHTPKPFASDFLSKVGISTASTAQRAARSLAIKDIIDRDEAGYFVTDRFLAYWIRKEVSL